MTITKINDKELTITNEVVKVKTKDELEDLRHHLVDDIAKLNEEISKIDEMLNYFK